MSRYYDRIENRFQDHEKAVAVGKDIEGLIIEEINAHGMKLKPSSHHEDKKQGIDGWLERNGIKIPVQIKRRDTGDDILFETLWDMGSPPYKFPKIKSELTGRDARSKAQLFICLNRKGNNIIFVRKSEIDPIVWHTLQLLDFSKFTQSTDRNGDPAWDFYVSVEKNRYYGNVRVRIARDPRRDLSYSTKMVMFIPKTLVDLETFIPTTQSLRDYFDD